MIDGPRHEMIGKVLDMLNGIPDELFDQSQFQINVELHDKNRWVVVNFNDESGEWTYEVETQ